MGTQKSEIRNQRPGFTLVELLVVIAIIAVLASLILVGGRAALVASRQAAIQAEISQLDSAFIEYTNDRSGGDYPPNVIWASGIGTNSDSGTEAFNTFKRHFNKAFPKHRESNALLAVLAGQGDTGGVNLIDGSGATVRDGLTPYEAVVFWLGGFSDDPKYPISGPGGPSFVTNSGGTDQSAEDFGSRTPIFDFDQTRLGPRAGDNTFGGVGRYITYDGPNDERRRINLWVYVPRNREIPYVYFDASRKPKFDPQYDGVVPVKQVKLNATDNSVANVRLANEGKCQILSAGLDDAWGPLVTLFGADWTQPDTTFNGVVYPDGPFTGEAADTITNFSTSATLEDSQP